jgi:hypothetical protein
MLCIDFPTVEEVELGVSTNLGGALRRRAIADAPKEYALAVEASVSRLTLGSLLLYPAPGCGAAVPAVRCRSTDVATASGASLLPRSYNGPSMPPAGGG